MVTLTYAADVKTTITLYLKHRIFQTKDIFVLLVTTSKTLLYLFY